MITAVSEATVPQFSVIVRKAYGAGLYAMAGPGFGPDATLALPTARIAVMGPEAAVNAVYANKIATIADPTSAQRSSRTAGASTRRTSTSSGWSPTWCSTASSRPTSCARSCCTASGTPRAGTGPSAPAGAGCHPSSQPSATGAPERCCVAGAGALVEVRGHGEGPRGGWRPGRHRRRPHVRHEVAQAPPDPC